MGSITQFVFHEVVIRKWGNSGFEVAFIVFGCFQLCSIFAVCLFKFTYVQNVSNEEHEDKNVWSFYLHYPFDKDRNWFTIENYLFEWDIWVKSRPKLFSSQLFHILTGFLSLIFKILIPFSNVRNIEKNLISDTLQNILLLIPIFESLIQRCLQFCQILFAGICFFLNLFSFLGKSLIMFFNILLKFGNEWPQLPSQMRIDNSTPFLKLPVFVWSINLFYLLCKLSKRMAHFRIIVFALAMFLHTFSILSIWLTRNVEFWYSAILVPFSWPITHIIFIIIQELFHKVMKGCEVRELILGPHNL